MWFMPFFPDLPALDWEARLLSKLSAWGYQVLNKPHPESISSPPVAFANQFGVRTLTERFERVMHAADASIFTDATSTTFRVALASNKPVVWIDFGLPKWVPEARAMLERRCRVVRGWFDEANRAQVDWDELREAIEESRDLMDMAFVDNYFEYEQ